MTTESTCCERFPHAWNHPAPRPAPVYRSAKFVSNRSRRRQAVATLKSKPKGMYRMTPFEREARAHQKELKRQRAESRRQLREAA